MEAEQNKLEQPNIDIESMSDLELGLLLGDLYRKVFQDNQNIQAVENCLRRRMQSVRIETAPEQKQ